MTKTSGFLPAAAVLAGLGLAVLWPGQGGSRRGVEQRDVLTPLTRHGSAR